MSETLTITLSNKDAAYLRKYAGSLGQPFDQVASELMALLLNDMEADERKQFVKVPLVKGGVH